MFKEDVLKQKRMIVDMVHKTGIPAHISPAFAMMEIFNVLLRNAMRIDKGIDSDESDNWF